jgi:dolichyl-phosphate beta-glucosyltransferase
MTPTLDVSIIIPAFNEEKRLGDTLERILCYLKGKGHSYEIIVVDDGSGDGTVTVAERFSQRGVRILRNDRNRGKGFTVRHGMLQSSKELVLFSDADLSTPIEEVEKLAAPILAGKAQVAIGSRAVAGAQIEISQPLYRVAMGKMFNLFVRLVALGGIHDTQCGFKLFTRRAAQEVFRRQRLSGFGFDVEILAIARRLGFSIAEVPVRWINSEETKVDALRDSARMLFDLFNVRWNDFRGLYR